GDFDGLLDSCHRLRALRWQSRRTLHYTVDVTEDSERGNDGASSSDVADRGFRGAPVTAALFMTNIGVFAAEIYLAGDWRWAIAREEVDQRRWDHILRWLGANASLWTIADSRFET